ncbi:MAG TPA: hypothetical protein VIQ81_02325 [Gammaproteobacteria bacterium]
MKINGENPKTGEIYQAEADDIDYGFIESMSTFGMSDDEIKRFIDNLDISADVKSLLYSFSRATIKVGQFIVKIGRKIIDFVCLLHKEYPNVIFGMIFGAIVGFLISTIPVLGAVLGPIAGPIFIVFGMSVGLAEDIKDKALARRITVITAEFSALNV